MRSLQLLRSQLIWSSTESWLLDMLDIFSSVCFPYIFEVLFIVINEKSTSIFTKVICSESPCTRITCTNLTVLYIVHKRLDAKRAFELDSSLTGSMHELVHARWNVRSSRWRWIGSSTIDIDEFHPECGIHPSRGNNPLRRLNKLLHVYTPFTIHQSYFDSCCMLPCSGFFCFLEKRINFWSGK